jgi:hypothetical protein
MSRRVPQRGRARGMGPLFCVAGVTVRPRRWSRRSVSAVIADLVCTRRASAPHTSHSRRRKPTNHVREFATSLLGEWPWTRCGDDRRSLPMHVMTPRVDRWGDCFGGALVPVFCLQLTGILVIGQCLDLVERQVAGVGARAIDNSSVVSAHAPALPVEDGTEGRSPESHGGTHDSGRSGDPELCDVDRGRVPTAPIVNSARTAPAR